MKQTKKVIILSITAMMVLGLFFSAELYAKRRNSKSKTPPASHNFFAFEDASYHTSPDKRIGAKLLVDTTKVGPTIASMIHLTYLPGAHVKSRRHVFVTEVIHVLSGNLTVRIGDETKVLGANATAYIPPKAFHEYLNDSSDVVTFLQYYSPPGPEEEYRNWETPEQTKAVLKKEEEQKIKKAIPTHIIVPSQPPVPGSPKAIIGSVIEVDDVTKKSKTEKTKAEFKFKTNN